MKFWSRLCEETTFHGLADIYKATNNKWKVLWILLVILASVGTIYETYTIFAQFQSAPIATSQEIVAESPEFPYIVVCSLNGINTTKVKEKYIPPSHVTYAKISLRDFTRNLIIDEIYNLNGNTTLVENIATNMTSENVDVIGLLSLIGYEKESFIKQCGFNNNACTDGVVVITPQYDVEYGQCYSFKPLTPQDNVGVGLNLLIDAHTELTWPDYPNLIDGIAVRIEENLSSAEFGQTLVLPGTVTRINLKYSEYYLQEWNADKRVCVSDIPRRYLSLPYSLTVCTLECIYKLTENGCGCILSRPANEFVNGTNMTLCKNQSQVQCATNLRQKMFSNCSNGCLRPCVSKRYDTTTSVGRFPSEATLEWLRLNNVSDPYRWADNYILLQISFEKLEITRISQYPSLTADAFLCQIGGQIGLFLGASLLSVIQVFTLFIEDCMYTIKCKYLSSSSNTKVESLQIDGHPPV